MKNRDYESIFQRLQKIVRDTSEFHLVKTGYGSVLVHDDRSEKDKIRHHLATNLLLFAYTLWWGEY